MKHRINSIAINLRTLTDDELVAIIEAVGVRLSAAGDDMEKLIGERVRRGQPHLLLLPALGQE